MIGRARDPLLERLFALNRLLAKVVVVLAALVGLDLVWGLAPADDAALLTPIPQEEEADAPVERPPFSAYAPALRPALFKSDRVQRRVEKAALTLESEAASLELQGVIMGGEPQALVVDKRSGKTLRVGAGQVVGRVSVLEIQQDGVILFFQGEKIKLSL